MYRARYPGEFKADGKVELKEESTYDYLVILTNAGGEISLDESRLAVHEQKRNRKKGVSMLVSNGFATLFLVFHPDYSSGFQFTDLGEDTHWRPHRSQGPVQAHSGDAFTGGAGIARPGISAGFGWGRLD